MRKAAVTSTVFVFVLLLAAGCSSGSNGDRTEQTTTTEAVDVATSALEALLPEGSAVGPGWELLTVEPKVGQTELSPTARQMVAGCPGMQSFLQPFPVAVVGHYEPPGAASAIAATVRERTALDGDLAERIEAVDGCEIEVVTSVRTMQLTVAARFDPAHGEGGATLELASSVEDSPFRSLERIVLLDGYTVHLVSQDSTDGSASTVDPDLVAALAAAIVAHTG